MRQQLIKLLKNSRDDLVSGKDMGRVVQVLSSMLPEFLAPKNSLEKVIQDTQAVRPDLATNIEMVVLDPKHIVIEMLNSLLLKEYQQRDVYEQYSYLMFGPESIAVREHLKEHMDQEMNHIETLQKYVVSYGGTPTIHRLPLPDLACTTLEDVMLLDLELEAEAVKQYSEAIVKLEHLAPDYLPLRVDLENIVVQEQEHMMDLQRWTGIGCD